jgi:peptidoglycan/xylan/chitin deacetylase (PgdA/CDA1 family)
VGAKAPTRERCFPPTNAFQRNHPNPATIGLKPPALPPATTAADLVASAGWRSRVRAAARRSAIRALSWTRSRPRGQRFLRFPVYHHVFEDEVAGFAAHLRFYREHGEFLSIEDALTVLEAPGEPDGAYYCLCFDDGLKSCITSALPLLLAHGAPAAFFLPTAYVDGTLGQGSPRYWLEVREDRRLEFLDWDDCRRLAAAGMTFGSHTHSHAKLSDCSAGEVNRELRESKRAIERELGDVCRHFACPWGQPGTDFDPARDPALARQAGYRSFLTSVRGTNARRSHPYAIHRDAVAPKAGSHELRYVFWK